MHEAYKDSYERLVSTMEADVAGLVSDIGLEVAEGEEHKAEAKVSNLVEVKCVINRLKNRKLLCS